MQMCMRARLIVCVSLSLPPPSHTLCLHHRPLLRSLPLAQFPMPEAMARHSCIRLWGRDRSGSPVYWEFAGRADLVGRSRCYSADDFVRASLC